MRRLVPALLLVACGPAAEDFSDRYLETYCRVFEDECTSSLAFEACRARGAPTNVEPIEPAGCDYDRGRAFVCLNEDNWTCEPGADGEDDVIVAPDACAEVWTCGDDATD